jgi:hypothetical protein
VKRPIGPIRLRRAIERNARRVADIETLPGAPRPEDGDDEPDAG